MHKSLWIPHRKLKFGFEKEKPNLEPLEAMKYRLEIPPEVQPSRSDGNELNEAERYVSFSRKTFRIDFRASFHRHLIVSTFFRRRNRFFGGSSTEFAPIKFTRQNLFLFIFPVAANGKEKKTKRSYERNIAMKILLWKHGAECAHQCESE